MVNKNLWESETKHWHYIFEREITAFNNHSCYLCHVLRGNVLPSTFLLPPLDLCLKRKPCDHICTNLKGGGYACSCYPCYTPLGGKCNLLQCKINSNFYPFSYVNPGNSCHVRNMCSPSKLHSGISHYHNNQNHLITRWINVFRAIFTQMTFIDW